MRSFALTIALALGVAGKAVEQKTWRNQMTLYGLLPQNFATARGPAKAAGTPQKN